MSHGHRFNPEKAGKLLDPRRKEKLPPEKILTLFDLKAGEIVADFGAGNGFFTVPIAQATGNDVYAIDIEPKMLEGLKEHARESGIENITTIITDLANTTLAEQSVDKIFSSFVMHEVPDLPAVMEEIKRILKPNGRILILDWEAIEMNEGPPLAHRIPSDQLKATFESHGFSVEKQIINSGVYALIMTVDRKGVE
jgi:ubiquinone/menaquinone biosynthesis C-methylase UbiE